MSRMSRPLNRYSPTHSMLFSKLQTVRLLSKHSYSMNESFRIALRPKRLAMETTVLRMEGCTAPFRTRATT
ncbi:hypothetical protein BDW22DRAFT_1349780 [Trametopsis cervina]|nr:hypothetical protein BDW22DRAFT_1349780 [Trametopsis cervina]